MTESEARENPLGIPSDSLRIFLRRPSASPSYRMDRVCVCQECGDFSIHAWGGGQLDGQGLSPGPRRVRSGSPGTRCQGWMAREGKAGREAEGASDAATCFRKDQEGPWLESGLASAAPEQKRECVA